MGTLKQIGKPEIFDGAKQRVCQETILPIYSTPKRGHVTGLVWYLPIASQEPDTPAVLESVRNPKFDR